MKVRPILMSAPMVRAILNGQKTQTRRIAPIADLSITQHNDDTISWGVKFSRPLFGSISYYSGGRFSEKEARRIIGGLFCPYGMPGDRLWVRETFAIVPRTAYASARTALTLFSSTPVSTGHHSRMLGTAGPW